jgi:hypothetical protein
MHLSRIGDMFSNSSCPLFTKGGKPRLHLVWLLIGIVALSGCSKEEGTTNGGDISRLQHNGQQHSGELKVRILPEVPTSTDDLNAVFSSDRSVSWQWEKNGRIIEKENTPRLSCRLFIKGDVISVIALSGGKKGKTSVTIANTPPEIRQVRLTPDRICAGVEITAVPDGFDANGDEVGYNCKWIINGEDIYEKSLSLNGKMIKKGDSVSVEISPFDSFGTGSIYRTQAFVVPNAMPEFISAPPSSFQGRIYSYKAVAKDPDDDTISYYLARSPKGMTIDGQSGIISWQIKDDDIGTHSIEIVAQDSEGAKCLQQYTLNINL